MLEMEHQTARRRINLISSHLVTTDDISASHVIPMNCSSSLNSVIRRCDNRMYFARQGSSSQACFMRQGSSAQSGVPLKYSNSTYEGSSVASEAPLFSRTARRKPTFPNVGVAQQIMQDCKSYAPDPPNFARPSRTMSGHKQLHTKKKMHSESNGNVWCPRMDVAESGCNYVVTVELPGVTLNDIRVEINDQSLVVTGKRSIQWQKVANYRNDSIPTYHRREILPGPYQLVWPLPANVNKDGGAAEFAEGILQITIPKL